MPLKQRRQTFWYMIMRSSHTKQKSLLLALAKNITIDKTVKTTRETGGLYGYNKFFAI